MPAERLQKILSQAGFGSRRGCEALISAGRVIVNGQPAELGQKVDPAVDQIIIDGQPLARRQIATYVMLHKPVGYISDMDVMEKLPTARSLIPLEGHLYPVGRLDVKSEGLMLFTNDGDLAHKLTHPRYEHQKTYRVLVERSPSQEVLNRWRRGVVLHGERTLPARVERLEAGAQGGTWLEVSLREGRKRQIRQVAALIGHPALRLIRTHIGPLALGDLPEGAWRALTEEELESLRRLKTQPAKPKRTVKAPAGRPPGKREKVGKKKDGK